MQPSAVGGRERSKPSAVASVASTMRISTLLILARLLLTAPLWVLALLDMQRALAVGLALAALIDALDGSVARWLGQSDAANSRLDSLADRVQVISVLAWLLLLHPAVARDHLWLWLGGLLLIACSWLVGLVRWGRVSALHLYSGRVAGALQALFVLHAFWSGAYSPPLLYAAAALWYLAAAEEIVVQLTRDHVDGTTRSALPLPRRRGP
jgi:phosphatidylglycerophosphate synthase